MLNKTQCRRKLLFGFFLSYSERDIHVKGSKCCDICAKDCDYGTLYVMSKNNLLSLKIVAVDFFFNIIHEDIHFSYTSKYHKIVSSTQKCNS